MDSAIFKKWASKATENAIPMQASLELTYRCNERCTHCYIENFSDDPKRVLNLEDWYKVIDELRSAGTLYLILMGGEPLLSPYFLPITQRATALGFHVAMISNGLKIKDAASAKGLVNAGLKLATFSLYSLNPATHDKMTRVKGSHTRLLAAIDHCLDAGLTVSINSLLTEANCREIFDLYDWCQSKGLEIKVDPNITPKLNGDLAPTQMRASKESLLWFYRERSKRWRSSTPSPVIETSNSYICNAAKGKCAVNPYGELLPCIEIRESFGSLVTQSFAEIWHSPAAIKWRTPRLKDLTNPDDVGIYSYCDHCPGMAMHEHGDPMALTDYTRLVGEVKKQVHNEVESEDATL